MEGGWKCIANIDITTGGDCPGEWHKETRSGVSNCCSGGTDMDSICSSATFPPMEQATRVYVVEQEITRKE